MANRLHHTGCEFVRKSSDTALMASLLVQDHTSPAARSSGIHFDAVCSTLSSCISFAIRTRKCHSYSVFCVTPAAYRSRQRGSISKTRLRPESTRRPCPPSPVSSSSSRRAASCGDSFASREPVTDCQNSKGADLFSSRVSPSSEKTTTSTDSGRRGSITTPPLLLCSRGTNPYAGFLQLSR